MPPAYIGGLINDIVRFERAVVSFYLEGVKYSLLISSVGV